LNYSFGFDECGRFLVNDPVAIGKLRTLLQTGLLDIVLGPRLTSGPMEAGMCPIPPKPLPPVVDCADPADIFRLVNPVSPAQPGTP